MGTINFKPSVSCMIVKFRSSADFSSFISVSGLVCRLELHKDGFVTVSAVLPLLLVSKSLSLSLEVDKELDVVF